MATSADLNSRQQSVVAQTVSNAGTYDLLLTAGDIPKDVETVVVTGVVSGVGPLTGFKMSTAAVSGGTHVDRLVDGDFDTPTEFLRTSTFELYDTATGDAFQFEFDARGIGEFKLYGKSANGAAVAFEIGS